MWMAFLVQYVHLGSFRTDVGQSYPRLLVRLIHFTCDIDHKDFVLTLFVAGLLSVKPYLYLGI